MNKERSATVEYKDKAGNRKSVTVRDTTGTRSRQDMMNEARQKVRDKGYTPGNGHHR